ncbi:tetratricopeptide repeat domain-containing protein [Ditylenchus destructor]|uniref:Tetratricopeptide repeat domain-containing protein n=1 Tax=Ditylenchus destructor TaxID=166010 RepID=A0AAD4RBW7_9BILA|nr:tetratricopeptide repeat domain-containing protein [Ditylenchus destructor]
MSADAQEAVKGEKSPNKMDTKSYGHQIDELFADAYKLFITHSYELAAEKFSESTELAVKLYGQFAPECFKHHYYYGRSLLEISHSTFGGGVEHLNKSKELGIGNSMDDKINTEAANESKIPESSVRELHERAPDKEDNDSEEEVSDSLLAWETLEVARKICESQEKTPAWLEKEADVLVSLADCLILAEHFDKALEELHRAFAIQQNISGFNNRKIAETCFNIGRTYHYNREFKKAVKFYENTANAVQNIIDMATEKARQENSDPAALEEIIEMKSLLSDIHERIQDSLESEESIKGKYNDQILMVMQQQADACSLKSLPSVDNVTKTFSDITAQVRKKRLSTVGSTADMEFESKAANMADHWGDSGQIERDTKKLKIDEGSN